MKRFILLFLLFVLPLVVLPFGTSYFETPKVILAEITIEFLFFLTLIQKERFSFRRYHKLSLYLLAGIFLLSLYHLIFLRSATTLFGNIFRMQGVFLLWHVLVFSFLASRLTLSKKYAFLFPLSLVGLFLSMFFYGSNGAGRIVGSLGEPNALAASAVFLWSWCFFYPWKNRSFVKWGSLFVAFLIVLFSNSQSGMIALFIQVFFLLGYIVRKVSFGKMAAVCLLLIVGSLALPYFQGGGVYENRWEVWQTAVRAGFLSPVVGSGFGNIEHVLRRASTMVSGNIQYQYVDSAHNLLLDYWVQGGVLGVLCMGGLMLFFLKACIKEKDSFLLVAFLGVVTTMLFNPASIVTLVAFWFLLGQSFTSEGNLLQ